jgi:hypothetical protein
MSDQTRDPELTALEAALAALRPVPDAIERDRLMFQAGRASVPRPGWKGPVGVAGLAVLTFGLGLAVPRPPAPDQRLSSPDSVVIRSDEGSDATSLPRASYLRLRQVVLRDGIEAMTASPAESPAHPPAAPDFPERPSPLGNRTFRPSGDPS